MAFLQSCSRSLLRKILVMISMAQSSHSGLNNVAVDVMKNVEAGKLQHQFCISTNTNSYLLPSQLERYELTSLLSTYDQCHSLLKMARMRRSSHSVNSLFKSLRKVMKKFSLFKSLRKVMKKF